MAKLLHVVKPGLEDGLQLEDAAVADPEKGEVRLKVSASALNQADILYINSMHYTELTFPSRIGSEASGVVEAVGEGVSDIKVGDRVSTVPFFSTAPERHGVHGEYAIVPAEYCASWPDGLTAQEGCSVWMQYLTAYFSLNTLGELKKGDTALIIAGASSAGIGAIQIAKSLGANVVATTRSASKNEFLKNIGADHVINTTDEAFFHEQLQEMTDGKGIKFAFDPVAGSFLKAYTQAMARDGKIAVYGMLSGTTDIIVPILDVIRTRTTVHAYSMYNYVSDPSLRKEGITYITKALESGKIKPIIDRVFALQDYKDAYAYMSNGSQCGKIILQP